MNRDELFKEIGRLLEEERGFALATLASVEGKAAVEAGSRWIVLPSGTVKGAGLSSDLKEFLSNEGREAISIRKSRLVTFAAAEGKAEFFIDPLAAPEPLVVAGAGHIALPLVSMAAQAGFRVIVLDDRPGFATRERFPLAWKTITAPFAEGLSNLPFTERTCVVLITRGHRYDRECLEVVIEKPAAYVGLIGSRRRVQSVFGSLIEANVPREKLDAVHSPIGLDIGAESPAEIAVSIVAELVAVRRQGGSRASLSARNG